MIVSQFKNKQNLTEFQGYHCCFRASGPVAVFQLLPRNTQHRPTISTKIYALFDHSDLAVMSSSTAVREARAIWIKSELQAEVGIENLGHFGACCRSLPDEQCPPGNSSRPTAKSTLLVLKVGRFVSKLVVAFPDR
jgi:hypothetical protein